MHEEAELNPWPLTNLEIIDGARRMEVHPLFVLQVQRDHVLMFTRDSETSMNGDLLVLNWRQASHFTVMSLCI